MRLDKKTSYLIQNTLITFILFLSILIFVEFKQMNEQLSAEALAQEQTRIVDDITNNDIYDYASSMYSVPKELIIAIERLETANYTSELYTTNNNTFGCKNASGKWCGFDTTEQSTLELARTLSFKYKVFNEYYDLEMIAKSFCPTDPEWSKKVEGLINENS